MVVKGKRLMGPTIDRNEAEDKTAAEVVEEDGKIEREIRALGETPSETTADKENEGVRREEEGREEVTIGIKLGTGEGIAESTRTQEKEEIWTGEDETVTFRSNLEVTGNPADTQTHKTTINRLRNDGKTEMINAEVTSENENTNRKRRRNRIMESPESMTVKYTDKTTDSTKEEEEITTIPQTFQLQFQNLLELLYLPTLELLSPNDLSRPHLISLLPKLSSLLPLNLPPRNLSNTRQLPPNHRIPFLTTLSPSPLLLPTRGPPSSRFSDRVIRFLSLRNRGVKRRVCRTLIVCVCLLQWPCLDGEEWGWG